jgi:quercetin dioxygenase-like cupin family protein
MTELTNNAGGRNMPIPFILNLPDDGVKHFGVLNNSQSLKLHSGMVCLTPGQDVGSHSTEDYEELLVILEGRGELEAEGLGRKQIASGQVAYNPPNTIHNVFNTGTDNLRYIYIVTKTI